MSTDAITDSASEVAAPVELSPSGDPGSMALSEALARYDVVSANPTDGYMIVTEKVQLRDPGMTVGVASREIGYTSPSPFTSWTRRDDNTKLQGQTGTRIYYNMRRQDGAVRASMRLVKTPVQGAHWFVEPWSADDSTEPTTQDKNVAKFVANDLFENLNVSWATLMSDILLMCDYGYMAFEKVFGFGPDGKLHLQKLAPRHPLDIQEWIYDANGGPNGCKMFSNPYSGPSELSPGTGMGTFDEIFVPIEKLVVYTHEAEAGDLTGIPILRSAYKHWYYKDTLYKIDAIQKERHGIGVPIIKLPPGFTKDDQALADNLGRNLRTNERAHVTLPPLWDLIFAKLEGQPVDCLKSIEHHDMRIKSNVLGSFLDATTGTQDTNVDIFLKSTRYIADYICDIFNQHVIKQLVDINFTIGVGRGYPRLRARRIGEWEDLRTLSFAIRNLVGSDVIRADDRLEAHMRQEMDLPLADPSTARSPVIVRPPLANSPLTKGEETAVSDQALAFEGKNAAGGSTAPNGGQKQDASANRPGQPRQAKMPPKGPGTGGIGTDRSGG